MKNSSCLRLATSGLGLLLPLLPGCVNMSSLQTAETLPPGTGRFIIGGGYYTSPSLNDSLSSATGTSENLKIPYLEADYRRGVAKDWEVGGKVTIIGTVAVDGKYRFLDAGDFNMAVGAGVGYGSVSSSASASSGSSSSSAKSSTSLFDVTVPVYASYRFADAFALYASPKYDLRYIHSSTTAAAGSTSGSASSSGTLNMFGGTGGIMLGRTSGVALECTYMTTASNPKFSMLQFGGGIFF